MNHTPTIGIVIPSYAEGTSIAQTIAGFAMAANNVHDGLSTSITVVVNESDKAPVQAKKSNHTTLRFLQALKQGEVIDEVNAQEPQFIQQNYQPLFPSAWQSELEAAKKVIAILAENKNISLDIVDLHSIAPVRCNVGIARNAGVSVLMNKYSNLAKIIIADGDTQPTSNHLSKIIEHIELPFFHGPRVSLCPVEFESTLSRINRHYYILDIFRCFRETVIMGHPDAFTTNDFVANGVDIEKATTARTIGISESPEGAHMVFSREVFDKIGGFAELPGGEDTAFGLSASRMGYTPHLLPDLPVATIERLSDRTTTGQGGSNMYYAQDTKEIRVIPMDILNKFPDFFGYLSHQNGRRTKPGKVQKDLEILIPGLKNMSPLEWQMVLTTVIKDGKMVFDETIGTELVSFLEKRRDNTPLGNAVRMFDIQSKSQLSQLGLSEPWDVFKEELRSIGIKC